MRLYALVELGDPEAIDIFLRKEDAIEAIAGCVADEPGWRGLLEVEPFDLEFTISPN
jgi:hypothetical protein